MIGGRMVTAMDHRLVYRDERILSFVILAVADSKFITGQQRAAGFPGAGPLRQSLCAIPQYARTVMQFFHVVMPEQPGQSALLCHAGTEIFFVSGSHARPPLDSRIVMTCIADG